MLTGTFHFSFTVSDMSRTVAFYRDVLGLEVRVEYDGVAPYLSDIVGYPNTHLGIVFIRLPGTTVEVELIEYKHPRGETRPLETRDTGNAHICFYVDDIEATYADWRARGIHIVSPRPVEITSGPNKGAKGFYFRDPDGISLELFQRPPGK